jgi:tetratricopeptide (TPR) repeat protein
MLVGMLAEGKGDRKKAMEAYERILAENPRFAPAANDLAYFLSETGGDKERALQLAQVAKEAAPDEPHISDTLGWILYQRRDPRGRSRFSRRLRRSSPTTPWSAITSAWRSSRRGIRKRPSASSSRR